MTALRAGLADVHYRWGQVLSDRYATEDAIRHFEEAYGSTGRTAYGKRARTSTRSGSPGPRSASPRARKASIGEPWR